VQRAIVGFEHDEVGDWVALLECGHRQHVRHRPPWQERPWVLSPEGRQGRLGGPLECAECDGAADEDVGEVGDPACYAHKVCPECGVVIADAPYRPGCANA
jgi:hypothetical protein